MPTVVNGIGTWYYGKNRVHRRKDVCSYCNGVGELTSYDTTLYFVVFFIPLLPLGKKRILEECPSCQKHRLVKLGQWEAAKEADIARLLEDLQRDPDNRDTILRALHLAVYYQDETLYDKLAGTLAEHRKDDAAIQAQLGYGCSYFVRYPEAEKAFRAALAVEDTIEVRQALALTLLKQLRPDEARPYLKHILDQRMKSECDLLYLLIEAYQAQGMHQEALEVMDQRDAAFPELATEKDIQKQRQTSVRNLGSGKPIRPVFLTESGKAGYREGGGGAKLAKIIGPLLLLGLLALYLVSAIWIGQSRQVFLVNGFEQSYRVAVNGEEYTLHPGAAIPVRLAEGEIVVESRDPKVPLEPARCVIETSFFTRPFASHTFVLNPDQLAVIEWEEAEYAADNPKPNQMTPHVGKLLHAFSGIDYEFAPFPLQVQAKKGQRIRKTRVALERDTRLEARLQVLSVASDESGQTAYLKRWLHLDPENALCMAFFISKLKDAEALEFLKPGLSVRPVRIEWHRAYQTVLGKSGKEQALRAEYEKLVAETKGHADALYLLGRIQDTEEADGFFRKAAEATPPSAYAVHARGFDALARGQFREAVAFTEKARQLAPRNSFFHENHRLALFAAGEYERLLEELLKQPRQDSDLTVVVEKVRIHAAKGERENADATINTALMAFPHPADAPVREMIRTGLHLVLASARNDVAEYLKLLETIPEKARFESAFLRGKLQETAAGDGQRDDRALMEHGLLYLAARKAGDESLAEAQWRKLLDLLAKEDHHQRRLGDMLAGRKPLDGEIVRRLPIEPRKKRVLLAVVAQRLPERSQELHALAKALDFHKDGLSLCLARVLE